MSGLRPLSGGECECARSTGGCGLVFGSESAFDAHRVDGRCEHPASLVWGDRSKLAGLTRFRPVQRRHGITWVADTHRTHWQGSAERPDISAGTAETGSDGVTVPNGLRGAENRVPR